MKQGGTAVYPSLAVIAEDVFIWKRGLAVDTRRRWRMVMETELEINYKKSDEVQNGEKDYEYEIWRIRRTVYSGNLDE